MLCSDAPAEQIFGVELDPIAVMIAKFNYFLKFPSAPAPHIYCSDFFTWLSEHPDEKFEYIIGNPPYGADINTDGMNTIMQTGESFSLFIEACFPLTAPLGYLRFLVPESLLNVKRHIDIRRYILKEAHLTKIINYANKFSGVLSNIYSIELRHVTGSTCLFDNGFSQANINLSLYGSTLNNIFIYMSETDQEIIAKISAKRKYDLSKSTFGLGVVTGNNKTKLLQNPTSNTEPIYTGKEITRKFVFDKPTNYIVFDRKNLQQVAPDAIYRAPIKLVYKTISKCLKIVIDETSALTTNAANIIIPDSSLNSYVIAGILNSDAMSFYYMRMFGGVNKVAKETLMQLPLPNLSKDESEKIISFVHNIIAGNETESALQEYVNKTIYNLSDAEIEHVNTIIK